MQEGLYVFNGGSGLTARCFDCRNRHGLINLIVLGSGVLCCRRCWASRENFGRGLQTRLEVLG